jgi:hypothetical protein
MTWWVLEIAPAFPAFGPSMAVKKKAELSFGLE